MGLGKITLFKDKIVEIFLSLQKVENTANVEEDSNQTKKIINCH